VKAFAPQVDFGRTMLLRQIRRQFPGEGGESAARVYGAMFDMVIDGAGQTDALCAGVSFSTTGASAEAVIQPGEGTRFAALAAKFRPARSGLLDGLDVPAISAAEWDLGPELMKEIVGGLKMVIDKGGMLKDNEDAARFVKLYGDMLAAMSGPMAFTWDAPARDDGPGVLRMIEVVALKRGGEAMKSALKEQSSQVAGLMNAFQMPIKFSTEYKADVETHRNCGIDRMAMRFEQNPDARGADANLSKMLETFYGPELVQYYAIAGDKLVVTVGYAKTDVIKTQIDRVLDGTRGNLRRSAFWRDAVKDIPANRTGVLTISAAKMFQTFMAPALGPMMGPAGPEVSTAIRGVTFEKPAASAVAFGPAKNGLALHVNVPMQEMLNLKQLFKTMMDANPYVKSAHSMNNVRQIGLACNQYAGEHDGDFPPNIETLLKRAYLTTPKVLIAPGSGDAVRDNYPADLREATIAQLKLGPTECSYVLVKGIRSSAPVDTIVIYEKKPFYVGRRCVWFNDGHIENVPEERFQKLLAEQRKKLKDR